MRVRQRTLCIGMLLGLAGPLFSRAATVRVPQDQPTIQAGINSANPGDTVLVAAGMYRENINFGGKAIEVISASGPKVTIIDGGKIDSVVTFNSGETTASVLRGFTIQNGDATNTIGEGGGISVEGSSPAIVGNIIVKNVACEGDGIGVGFGSPIIQNNLISNNFDTCGGIGGGGVGIRGASSAQVLHNRISNNSTQSFGGGIALWSGNAVLIKNNTIVNNYATSNGGGISMFNDVSSVVIVQNLINGNTSATGDGIYWSNPPELLVSNTIRDSGKIKGGATLWADGFCCSITMVNNIIVADAGATNAVTCNYADFPANSFTYNDAYSSNGAPYGGVCTDQTGTNGNLSANPLFGNPSHGNLQLQAGSPAINAGNNSAPDLPLRDLIAKPRIVGGTVDMGAYEFQ